MLYGPTFLLLVLNTVKVPVTPRAASNASKAAQSNVIAKVAAPGVVLVSHLVEIVYRLLEKERTCDYHGGGVTSHWGPGKHRANISYL